MNHAIDLLEAQRQYLGQFSATNVDPVAGSYPRDSCSNLPQNAFPSTTLDLEPSEQILEDDPVFYGRASPRLPSSNLPNNHRSSAIEILEWPVFKRKYSRCDLDALVFSSSPTRSFPIGANDLNYSNGLREQSTLRLLQSFVENVHSKNPVLDIGFLETIARDVDENGMQWDGESCLLSTVCALGTISSSFSIDALNSDPKQQSLNSVHNTPTYSAAEAYYTASRKRIGLLGSSILTVQCHFLIGVYEMYTLRPLQAWTSFHRACTIFQTYLKGNAFRTDLVTESISNLEHRLYWSCLKSEW